MKSKRYSGYYQNQEGSQEKQYSSIGYQRAKYENWLHASYGFSKEVWQKEVISNGYEKPDHTED